ncbi:MAG: hypothetical protein GX605_02155 [Chloroflexi bacterium]|nr:hypothetical protein [Chloroflexota bacterium]
MPSEQAIRSFLERYGEALGRGDIPAVVDAWDLPALVISDQGGLAVLAASEIEQHFAGAVQWYRARGLFAPRPKEVRVEPLSKRLVSVDVRWASLDAAGAEVAEAAEHSRYILHVTDDGALRFQVAIALAP